MNVPFPRAAERAKRASGLPAASCVAVLLVSTLGTSAMAQEGFALNRFEPSERGSEWFALDSLDLRGHGRWAAGVVGDWSHRPLVLYDEAGDKVQALLDDQVYAYVGGSVVWWDRLRLSASFPVVLASTTEAASEGAATLPVASGANVGDLRFGVDVRLVGEHGDVFSLALGTHVHAPTGSREAYTGDGKWRLKPHVLAAGTLGKLEYAASTGVDVRGTSSFAGQELGSQWVFAASGGVRVLDGKLLVGPELWGATLVSSSFGAFDKEGTPIEALLGAHYGFKELNFGLGVGPGLSRGLGSPMLRALASLQWIQDVSEPVVEPPPPLDRDGDGIVDTEDACPVEAGPTNADALEHGCPLPTDGDADGILDLDDACPAEAGEATSDRKTNGCPPPDTDADGILDRDDACLSEPGVKSDDAARNGCPLPTDRDGDKINDELDACPEQAGEPDADPARNGCPRVSLQGDRVQVLDRIEFENGKATLTPESEPILAAVAKLLLDHPEIRKLDVQGHTDSRGQHARNVDLSKRRAAAVVRWLGEHGIETERLSSQGFGPDRPLDDNASDAGRQRNRRVEFHVVDTASDVPSSSSGTKEGSR
jgi:outer membrane protein OmpA-like peptidoglycan-associated protein